MKINKKAFTFFEMVFVWFFIIVIIVSLYQYLIYSKIDVNEFKDKCNEIWWQYYKWRDNLINKCYFSSDNICYTYNCLEKKEFLDSNFKK